MEENNNAESGGFRQFRAVLADELVTEHPDSLLAACLCLCHDTGFLQLDYTPFNDTSVFGFHAVRLSAASVAVTASRAQLSTHRARYRRAPWEPPLDTVFVQLLQTEVPTAEVATAFPSQANRVARYLEQRSKFMSTPATAEQLGLVLTDSSTSPLPFAMSRANPVVHSCTSVAVVSDSLLLTVATSSSTLGLPSASYSADRLAQTKGRVPPQLLALRQAVTSSAEPSVAGLHLEHFVNRAAQRVSSTNADAASFCFTVRPFCPRGQADMTTIARRQFEVRTLRVKLPNRVQFSELSTKLDTLQRGPAASLEYTVLRPSSASPDEPLAVSPDIPLSTVSPIPIASTVFLPPSSQALSPSCPTRMSWNTSNRPFEPVPLPLFCTPSPSRRTRPMSRRPQSMAPPPQLR